MDTQDWAQGRKMACPVQVLWPAVNKKPDAPSPLEIWFRCSDKVTGTATRGGHLQPEDAPDEVLAALLPFLRESLAVNAHWL